MPAEHLQLFACGDLKNARGLIPTCREGQFAIWAENGPIYNIRMPNRQYQPGFLFLAEGKSAGEQEYKKEEVLWHGVKMSN